MKKQELAQQVYKAAYLRGEFKLRSGQTSQEYFDKYKFEGDPVLLGLIAEQMTPLIPSGTECLAGLEMGGIPIATSLSLIAKIPTSFVRKKAKDYGTEKLAEGSSISGRKVLVIEDVITTGGQVIESASALKKLGAEITHVLCVIDREQGGREKLKSAGLEMISLFTMTDLKNSVAT